MKPAQMCASDHMMCGSSQMMDVARDESGGWRGRAQRVLRAENLFGGSLVTVQHVNIHSKL